MNIKQQLQNAQGNSSVFKILKPSSGKSAKSSHGRAGQNNHVGVNNVMFSQTGKLVSAEVKADTSSNTNAKVKFNKTHGYQDNQFLIQNLKQTSNLSPSVTKALLAEEAPEGSALEQ